MTDQTGDPATLEEALDALHASRAEAQKWLDFIERGMETHMRFGVLNRDGTVEELPTCADWCYACRIERAESAVVAAHAAHAEVCPQARGEEGDGFTCPMCKILGENANPKMIFAPWTPEEVQALNRFQSAGRMHPFTCPEHTPGSPMLVADEDGWRCSDPYNEECTYRQDWAHQFMTSAELVRPYPDMFR